MSARYLANSPYLEWAKHHAAARYNLTVSGAPNVPFSEIASLPVDPEITTAHGDGYPPLIDAISTRYAIPPECIVTTAGCSTANHLAMAALLAPGDRVLLEFPVYDPLLSVATFLSADIGYLRRDPQRGFGFDLEKLARQVKGAVRLIVLTDPHNPTGALLSDSAVAEIGAIADSAGAHLLVDEVYLDLVDPPRRSAFRLGHNVIVTSSLTKVYGLSGLRCGWIAAPAALAERMRRLNNLFVPSPVHMGERYSVAVFPHLDAFRDRTRRNVAQNRERLHAFLDRRHDLEAVRAPSGTTSFPRLLKGSVERLCEVLRDTYETSVVPGAFFGMSDRFRIGLAGDPETFAEGILRLDRALDDCATDH